MKCHHCKERCIKKGKQKSGIQKFQCNSCKKYQQEEYRNKAWHPFAGKMIIKMIKRGSGIQDISYVLEISPVTIIKRIKHIASLIVKPAVAIGKTYQVDELKTYVGKKTKERWIAYAIRSDTKRPVDFKIGRRTKRTIGSVIETLLLSKAKKIYTDGLKLYHYLIPSKIHDRQWYNTNHIERKNLDLRTHLKRLGRKTICFSKSEIMLESCMKIYFWG